jgi:Uma2 family endonuclease
MTSAISTIQWTIEDLDAFPQNEWNRYEIIQGELFVTRAPHYRHQQVSFNLAFQLNLGSKTNHQGTAIITPGVIFSEQDSVIPDVVWISNERLAQIEDEAGHLLGAPELIVEVLSPGAVNEKRDRSAKRKLYSLYGVQEYWIVDRNLEQVEIYRRQEAVLTLTATLLSKDEISSPLLPDFRCAIARFFE